MGNIKAKVRYIRGVRHLEIRVANPEGYLAIVGSVYWSEKSVHQVPHVWLSWNWDYRDYRGYTINDPRARNVSVILYQEKWTLSYSVLQGMMTERIRVPQEPETHPLAGDRWNGFLSLCRQVAAGRAPQEAVGGWIEDNLPEPWCLLASPNPVDCFHRLCPIPLVEKKR